MILTTQDEIDTWLTAPAELALQLQRPLPDDALGSWPGASARTRRDLAA